MANRVVQFLIQLSQDPAAMDAFAKDPDILLAGADLTEAEAEAVRSADLETLYRSLSGGERADLLAMGECTSQSQIDSPEPPPGPPQDPPPGQPQGGSRDAAAAF